MRLTWLTDIHLSFLEDQQLDRLLKRLSAKNSDAVIISGDIGEADNLHHYLGALSAALKPPIYFVLGNHDYYRGTIEYVRSGWILFLVAMRVLL
jgi:predicted MPP superfamily phosphohydrolase